MELARQSVRDIKAKFNSLSLLRHSKERLLSKLLLEEATLATQSLDLVSGTEETLVTRQAELEETIQAYRNELYYQETLQFMLNSRKISAFIRQEPLKNLQNDLEITTKELNSRLKLTLNLESSLENITFQSKSLSLSHETTRNHHENLTKTAQNRYKDKQKLLFSLQFERNELNKIRKIHKMQSLISTFSQKLSEIEENERDFETLKSVQSKGNSEEKKFKAIQRNVSISSVLEMESYWTYLKANRQTLEDNMHLFERNIQELQSERDFLLREKREIVEEPGSPFLLTPQEAEEMDIRLREKEKELNYSEQNLGKLLDLLISVSNTVYLVATMVLERSDLDVKPSNAGDYLIECGNVLEILLKTEPKPRLKPDLEAEMSPSNRKSLHIPIPRAPRRKLTRRSLALQLPS